MLAKDGFYSTAVVAEAACDFWDDLPRLWLPICVDIHLGVEGFVLVAGKEQLDV